jgi:hypothetical protein
MRRMSSSHVSKNTWKSDGWEGRSEATKHLSGRGLLKAFEQARERR